MKTNEENFMLTGTNAYKKIQRVTSSNVDLVIDSYRFVDKNLTELKIAFETGKTDKTLQNVTNVQTEYLCMFSVLDFELGGKISESLAKLYKYVISNVDKITTPEQAKDLIYINFQLLEAFEEIKQQL